MLRCLRSCSGFVSCRHACSSAAGLSLARTQQPALSQGLVAATAANASSCRCSSFLSADQSARNVTIRAALASRSASSISRSIDSRRHRSSSRLLSTASPSNPAPRSWVPASVTGASDEE
ncbi:hypothetical protein Vretimale_13469 [Volvox reticuliferus]|uniref:Uncharacterized protein n=1 Tax=Volvox reticuliferus TaxID=1737510 RepID=A0A8J4LU33_9CHLO|nr:hypothetical protein Vretimale_13469 [Volvox reticuliferus]